VARKLKVDSRPPAATASKERKADTKQRASKRGTGRRNKTSVSPDVSVEKPRASVTLWDTLLAAEEGKREAARQVVVAQVLEPPSLAVTAENVLAALARTAFYDPRNLYKPDGTLKQLYELDATTACGLQAVEAGTLGVTKYKFHNRVVSLNLLGQYLKLFAGELKDKGALDELLSEFRKQYEVVTKSE
jgi:hypothetical protein